MKKETKKKEKRIVIVPSVPSQSAKLSDYKALNTFFCSEGVV